MAKKQIAGYWRSSTQRWLQSGYRSSMGIGGHGLSGNVGYRIIAANIREWGESPVLLQA